MCNKSRNVLTYLINWYYGRQGCIFGSRNSSICDMEFSLMGNLARKYFISRFRDFKWPCAQRRLKPWHWTCLIKGRIMGRVHDRFRDIFLILQEIFIESFWKSCEFHSIFFKFYFRFFWIFSDLFLISKKFPKVFYSRFLEFLRILLQSTRKFTEIS